MRQLRPLVLRGEERPAGFGGRQFPGNGWGATGGIDLGDLLQTPPHHLRERPLLFGGNLLGSTIRFIGDLNLRLNHDGNLP